MMLLILLYFGAIEKFFDDIGPCRTFNKESC